MFWKSDTMADEKMNNAEDAAAKDDAIKDNEHSAETAASVGAEDGGSPPESMDNLDPLAALEIERDSLKDQALRAMAEAENTRRRTERELSQARKYGHAGFARDLLAVVDNLKRAVDALPEDRSDLDDTMTNLVVGVEMIHQEITSVLDRHGITKIDPMGEKFDYDKHQAMFEIPTDEVEPGMVVQVAQTGWMLHDRLLTPAMVGVSKATEGKG
jgi:molecular chaperone GrpE